MAPCPTAGPTAGSALGEFCKRMLVVLNVLKVRLRHGPAHINEWVIEDPIGNLLQSIGS